MTAGFNGKHKKQIEEIIYKKIIWQCKWITFLWHIVFVIITVVDLCIKPDRDGYQGYGEYYNLIVTISTILTATVVFFYSIIDSRRMGITNRTIISYYVGSYTIPMWFMLTLVHLPVIRLFLNKGWYRAAAVDMACVFFLQLGIIYIILVSTSFRLHIKIILPVRLDFITIPQN